MVISPNRRLGDLSSHAFSMLTRMNIKPTPVNFELAYEIVSGNNPELRKQFLELGQNITTSDMDELGRKFLPHHFGDSIFEKSSGSILSELGGFQTLLNGSQASLTRFSENLSAASERILKIDPENTSAIRSELDEVSRAANELTARASRVLERVGQQMANVNHLNSEMAAANAIKFTHSTTGLGNRRALNRRMAELYAHDQLPRDCTLVFGRIVNFSLFGSPALLKAKEAVMAGLGGFIAKELQNGDAGFWLESPELAFIIDTIREEDIRAFTDRLRETLARQLISVGLPPAVRESLHISFGCAATISAENAAILIKNAEIALATALSSGEPRSIFYAVTEKLPESRDYYIYGRQQPKI